MKADTARIVVVPITAAGADEGSLNTPTGSDSTGASVLSVGSGESTVGVASGTVGLTVGEGEVVGSEFVSNGTTSGTEVHSPLYAIKSATAKQLLSYVLPFEHTWSIFLGQAKAMHSPS